MASRLRVLVRLCSALIGLGYCVSSSPGDQSSTQPITVQDVIDGMVARTTKILDIEIEYAVEVTYTDFFYELKKRASEHARRAGMDNTAGTTPADASDGKKKDAPATKRRSTGYRLKVKGDKLAYDLLDLDKGNAVKETFVFDGAILKGLQLKEKRGVVRLQGRDAAQPPETIQSLFHVENRGLIEYLGRTDIRKAVTSTRREGEDVFVTVRTWIEHSPDVKVAGGMPKPSIAIRTERVFTFNASKDFWPTLIQQCSTITDLAGGEQVQQMTSEIVVSAFVTSGGIWFPSSIIKKEYGTDFVQLKTSLLPKVAREDVVSQTELRVKSVRVNSGLADAAFELTFPSGTTYIDTRDDSRWVVDQAGVVTRFSGSLVPVSQARTPEEAAAIMERESTRLSLARKITVACCLIGIGGCLGFFTYRRMRRRVRR